MDRLCLALDNSQIMCFLHCNWEWYLRYHEKLKRTSKNTQAMDKGTIVHGLLERFYLRRYLKKSVTESCQYAVHALADRRKEFSLTDDDFKFLEQRFKEYCTHVPYLGNDFEIASRNGKPGIEIGFSIPLVDNEMFYFVIEGRIDLLAKWSNSICIVDHKTQLQSAELYPYLTQFITYCMVCEVNHAVVNYFGLQKVKNENTFRRQPIRISPQQIKDWKSYLITSFYKMAHAILTNCMSHLIK